jgi:hypothetical protein
LKKGGSKKRALPYPKILTNKLYDNKMIYVVPNDLEVYIKIKNANLKNISKLMISFKIRLGNFGNKKKSG